MKRKSLKVLLYGDWYVDASGFANEFRNIIPTFLAEGHEVRQVALRYNGVSKQEKFLIPLYPTQVRGVRNYWAVEMLEYAINDFEPDIVFSIQDYFVLPNLVQVLSKPFLKPFKWIHWGVMDGEPIDKRSAMATAWTHYNIYQANYTKKVIEKALPDIKGETIYPAVDQKIYHPLENREELKKGFNIDNKFNILFVGRNQYRKNLPALFEAVKKLSKIIPNIKLIHHSPLTLTPEGLPAGYELEDIVEHIGIKKYVSYFKGKGSDIVTEKVLNEIYNLADLFVLPSMGEGFGLPLIEAMACKIPTIGTDCSAITEVIGDRGLLAKRAGNIYTDLGTKHALVDVDDLANCIYRLSGDQELRKNCVLRGSEFIDELTPEKVSKRILEAFYKALDENYEPLATQKILSEMKNEKKN